MPFDKWIQKLEPHAKAELIADLIASMTDDDREQLIDDMATELNDRGHEWTEPATLEEVKDG